MCVWWYVLLGLYILGFQLSLPVLHSILCPACYYRHMLFYTYVAAILDYWGHTERRENEGEERESKARGEGEEREGERERLTGSGEGSLGGGSGLGSLSTVDRYNNRRSMMSEKPLTIDNMGYVLCLQGLLFLSSANNNTSEYLKGRLSTYISRFQHIYTWMHTFGGGTVYLAQRRHTGDKKMAKLAVRSGGGYVRTSRKWKRGGWTRVWHKQAEKTTARGIMAG